MTRNAPTPPIAWTICAILFLFYALFFTQNASGMFGDYDPLWHIASGDLIRSTHAIPLHDPWSFTAGEYRWINISWLWDSVFSFIHEQLGWHGAIAINAIIIALTIITVFLSCFARTGHIPAAFITTIAATSLMSILLRPLQVSNLLVALWLLLLGSAARQRINPAWVLILPATLLVWVNVHGGFLAGLLLMGAFFLHAMWQKDWLLAKLLFFSGIACVPALLCNPYGISMYAMVVTQMHPIFAQYTHEWQPMVMSFANMHTYFYVVAFPILVLRRPLAVLPVERWLAYLWFFLGVTSNRHLTLFAIIAAPVMACSIYTLFMRMPRMRLTTLMHEAIYVMYNRKKMALCFGTACLGIILWLPGPMAARHYASSAPALPTLAQEIAYLQAHAPKARLLNQYDLGSILLYETRGEIPLFVDPRGETALPPQVVKDYMAYVQSTPGWESILDTYHLDGVIIPNKDHDDLLDRFSARKGWKRAFSGPVATIFMRVHEKP